MKINYEEIRFSVLLISYVTQYVRTEIRKSSFAMRVIGTVSGITYPKT